MTPARASGSQALSGPPRIEQGQTVGEIVGICYKPAGAVRGPQFDRIALERGLLIADYGLDGDAKGGHPERQLNLLDAESLPTLAGQGYDVTLGQMGEQIRLRGIDFSALAEGVRLRLGAAVVEITSRRNGCARFEAVQGLPRSVPLGVMARVVESGEIRLGDAAEPI